ncbi:MAG: nuclear transport factor 2 family protein [Vampirovibrionia bacterium]
MLKNILKTCFLFSLTLIIVVSFNNPSFASSKNDIKIKANIMTMIKKLQTASNNHDIDTVASFYSENYLSGDNFDKEQVLKLIKDTWQTYPDIKYTSEIKFVRFSDSWASIESYDETNGTTGKISEITNDKGDMNSESHSVIYLRKIGKDWKIVGDLTYFETATVKFGTAKTLNIKFSSPGQVKAGEMYSAKILTEVPVGAFTVGSITQEPLIYPGIRPKEKFRTINQNQGNLERVFESNENNLNEVVTATVGITELTEDNQARPTVQLKGLCIIGNRINVIPHSTFDREDYIITNKESLDPAITATSIYKKINIEEK